MLENEVLLLSKEKEVYNYTVTEDKIEGYEETVYETEEDTLVVKNIFDTSKGGENVDPSPKK